MKPTQITHTKERRAEGSKGDGGRGQKEKQHHLDHRGTPILGGAVGPRFVILYTLPRYHDLANGFGLILGLCFSHEVRARSQPLHAIRAWT